MVFIVLFLAGFIDGEKQEFGTKFAALLQTIADYEGRIDWEVHYGDSTVVRAHQHSAGAKGGKKTKLMGVVREDSAQKSIFEQKD